MSSISKQRSINPVHKYHVSNVTNTYDKIYLGFVKDASDSREAGRLTVWIPDISTDSESLFVVQYCSMFAGATPASQLVAGSKTSAQQSYGWWGVPPDIDNMVLVGFINGDPGRGFWFGCLYQEYMTNMVPNIPEGNTTQNTVAPTYEYNKADPDQIDTDNPLRPTFTALASALNNQGLEADMVRGPAAFRSEDGSEDALSSKQNIMGLLTPGASQVVYDDSPDNKHIRFRTENGTQIIINDTIGFIYFITRSGNSWAELSDDGINFYSNGDISFRSQSNINFHADNNINMNSVGSTQINSNSNIVIQSLTNTNVLTGTNFTVNSGSAIGLLSDSTISAKGTTVSLLGTESIAISSQGQLGINSSGVLYIKGSTIQQNNGSGPSAISPLSVSGVETSSHSDVQNNGTSYPAVTTKSIVNTLPAHEPWSGHQSTVVGVSPTKLNSSVSIPDEVESGSSTSTASTSTSSSSTSSTSSSSTDDTTTSSTTSSNGTSGWVMPVTGEVNSLYGHRTDVTGLPVGSNHPGVDIHKNNGFPIYATKSGKVVYANEDKKPYTGYGKCVVIKQDDGHLVIYGHMSKMAVNFGDTIQQGQQIGNVGKTGYATGPHLHFEIRTSSGQKINPDTIFPSLGKLGTKVTALTNSPSSNSSSG